MFIKRFNETWEEERQLIAKHLEEKLAEEINSLDSSMAAMRGPHAAEDKLVLMKMRNELMVRKSMAIFESEDIARNRMQLRASYIALLMSSIALIISITTVLLKL